MDWREERVRKVAKALCRGVGACVMDDIIDDDHEPIICRPHNCRMMEIAQMAINVAMKGNGS